jgi:hypothetical protein
VTSSGNTIPLILDESRNPAEWRHARTGNMLPIVVWEINNIRDDFLLTIKKAGTPQHGNTGLFLDLTIS